MQQATVNLLADMGAQPMTLQSSLVATPKSTDDNTAQRDDQLAQRTAPR